MTERVYRLADLIDDYCPRCRLLLNHAVAGMVESKVAKVICQTCYSEHPYRHGEGGKKKKPGSGRAALVEQVLSKIAPPPPTASVSATDSAAAPDQTPKKKRPAVLTRYISRHKSKPRKGS